MGCQSVTRYIQDKEQICCRVHSGQGAKCVAGYTQDRVPIWCQVPPVRGANLSLGKLRTGCQSVARYPQKGVPIHCQVHLGQGVSWLLCTPRTDYGRKPEYAEETQTCNIQIQHRNAPVIDPGTEPGNSAPTA